MPSLHNLKQDFPASVVVFFVALPLCLGIALASGAPLFSGLIAGIVGGIVVGSISKSRLGVSGPAAGLTVIVLSALESIGNFEGFLLAVVLAGIMQIIFGFMRAGILGYFFPSAVINGMLTGIGLIIILKQIPLAVGYDSGQITGSIDGSFVSEIFSLIHPGVVVIALTSLAILIAWEKPIIARQRLLSSLPGPVVAVTFAIVAQFMMSGSAGFALDSSQYVSVPVASNFSEFMQLFTLPDFSQISEPVIWTTAITLAVVASLETLLSVEAIDKMDPKKAVTPTNRELVAQGFGNSCSGLLGGLPVTQVIVRSTVNLQSGAESRASAVLHGLLLLACVSTVPYLLNHIPLAVLASVLLITGYKLAKPALFKKMWTYGPEQFVPFIVTVAGVVLTDLLTGVGLGLCAAIVFLLQRNYRNSHFLHKSEHESEESRPVVSLKLAEEVTFLNKAAIKKELHEVKNNSRVIIDKRNCVYINHDVAEIINEFMETAVSRGITVEFIERQSPASARDGFDNTIAMA